ncbi:MAG: acyl-CoA dehydratase activase [Anaerovoracaceae bacterium]
MYVLGVDIGSTACKGVVLNDKAEIIASAVIPFGTGTSGPKKLDQAIFAESGIPKEDYSKIVATGYGRMQYEEADRQVSELSCHAKGVVYLNPEVKTIIDIGGQDAKAMKIDDKGRMENFVMNDKCAAGTGRFLDVMSNVLETDISNLQDLDKESTDPVSISNTCTVFAESEVISHLSANATVPNIVAGIHNSVAKRVASLAKRVGIKDQIVMVGGVAKNGGVVRAMSEALGKEVKVPPNAQLTGAIGAALYALDL